MKFRLISCFLCVLLCLSLCSCTRSPSSESEQVIVLPEPSPEAPKTIFGEQIASRPKSVSLHYVSGDGSSFSTITRSLIASPGENIYEEAVGELLRSASASTGAAFLPLDMQIIDTDYSCGIVTVNLSLDAYNIQNDQEHLMLLSSITNTLLSMDEVRAVNVLVNGQSRSIASLPVGALTQPLPGITPAYAQYSAERDYFLDSQTGTITRSAVLYFPTDAGEWFVPELREITFDSSDYVSALIRALRLGPTEASCAITAIPESADLLAENPSIEITSGGERIVELNFSPTLRNYLAFSGISEWELTGSIALTLSSFVPELDAVRICIDSEAITKCFFGENELVFTEGLIRRGDFDAFIGSTVSLYLPGKDGSLIAAERAVSMETARSPLGLLYALFDDVLSMEDGAGVFPSDVYYDDILGVSLEDSIVSVNLSGNFYRQAQSLTASEEKSAVYAIVNTLCELDNVFGVSFYIEGIRAETLSGNIYIRSVLLPNPGAVQPEASIQPETTVSP